MHDPDAQRAKIERDVMKVIVKEAIKEWLDDKFMQFGKWSVLGIAAAGLATLSYLILFKLGWKPPM